MATKRTVVRTMQQILVQLRGGKPIEPESKQEESLNDVLAFLLEEKKAEPTTLTSNEVSKIASDVMKHFFDLKTTDSWTKQRIRLALVTAMEDVLAKIGAKHG